MKRAVFIGLSLLLGSTMLAAQSDSAQSAVNGIVRPDSNAVIYLSGPTCPVSMRALQGSGFGGLVKVRGEPPVSGPAQRIHLILANPKAAKVASASVIVLGLSPRSHVERALSNLVRPPDVTRTLEVRFNPEEEKSVAADLLLPGFTAVISLELQSMTYQDGTTWSVAGRRACQVAPDPLMLIAGR
jgi:hypothetical protein